MGLTNKYPMNHVAIKHTTKENYELRRATCDICRLGNRGVRVSDLQCTQNVAYTVSH